MIYFTSDQHFDHRKIIEYCDRPFANIIEMNEYIISEHNKIVKSSDTVYNIGDFSFSNSLPFLKRLNGKQHLICGNHDRNTNKKHFRSASDSLLLSYHDNFFYMNHYPHRSWPKSSVGCVHIFGHAHGNIDAYPMSIDVGVDCNNFRPISIEKIMKQFQRKRINTVINDFSEIDSDEIITPKQRIKKTMKPEGTTFQPYDISMTNASDKHLDDKKDCGDPGNISGISGTVALGGGAGNIKTDNAISCTGFFPFKDNSSIIIPPTASNIDISSSNIDIQNEIIDQSGPLFYKFNDFQKTIVDLKSIIGIRELKNILEQKTELTLTSGIKIKLDLVYEQVISIISRFFKIINDENTEEDYKEKTM